MEETVKGSDKVKGYGGIEYTLDELRKICPKCYSVTEIEANSELKADLERQKLYHSKIYNNISSDNLPEEKWIELKDIPNYTRYTVSNWGRVKFGGEIIKQGDEQGRYGYLLLDPDKTKYITHNTYVYTLIAYAFLHKGTKKTEGLHVHHIDNNGYNCRPENLILLTPAQHSYVHAFSCEKYSDDKPSGCM